MHNITLLKFFSRRNLNCLYLMLITILSIIATPATAAFNLSNFSFSAIISDHQQGIVLIDMQVAPDHMLYRNQLSLKSSTGSLEVEWPTVTTKNDPFGSGMVDIYPAGTHQIKATIIASEPISDFELTLGYQGCTTMTCFMPTTKSFNLTFAPPLQPVVATSAANATPVSVTAASEATNILPQTSELTSTDKESAPRPAMSDDSVDFSAALADRGIYWVLLLSFIGGLLISLTPCVYPMIPITLSIIGSRDENVSFSKGLALSSIYVAGLSLTYALLGLAAATFGAQIRGILQSSLFQGLIAIFFFVLALSMFDLIIIQAPAGMRNRLGGVKKTGLFGIFVMGMISGLLASPCVAAPLAGILAFIATTGSQLLGFVMLLIFAWGMSLPLLIVGAFSGSMNALPKAGEWMNRVKEFYGFLLLAAALYFAWPVIGNTLGELGIAALLATLAAFMGLFTQIPENAGMQPRIFKSFAVVIITLACAFAISAISNWGYLSLTLSGAVSEQASLQSDITWNHDLEKALSEAGKTGKTIFIDFRADWCAVCRDLEKNVFPHPSVKPLLKELITVKIDATEPDEKTNAILEKYGIVGLPTLLFIGSDGKEISNLRIVGYIEPEQLEKKIRSVL